MSDERLTPKPLIHKHEEFPEHDWYRTEDGEIDEFAMSVGFHNGPVCKRCGYSFCHWCEPDGWNAEPCVVDEYRCSNCNHLLNKGDKFCSECGQEILQEDSNDTRRSD